MRAKFTSHITIEREEDVTLQVSAVVVEEHKQYYISNLETLPYPISELEPDEVARAEQAVIDQARCYPHTGISHD